MNLCGGGFTMRSRKRRGWLSSRSKRIANTMATKKELIDTALHSIGRSFYGGCVANLGNAPMRKGHNNQGRPFDIETACYLKPIFAAYDNPHVRKIVIKAGVKTVKSFAAEIMAAHFICHGN